MRNPDNLINNAVFRALARRAGMVRGRGWVRRTVLPLALPRSRVDRLTQRVRGYLESYFPELDHPARETAASDFADHYRDKFAEDCIVLNLSTPQLFLREIERHVDLQGADRFLAALAHGAGVLAVSCHVGSPTFGTLALLSLLLELPDGRYPPVRVCAEPEVQRYPAVQATLERAIRDFRGDGRFLYTQRGFRQIATEMTEALADGALVTTNLDVVVGGASEQTWPFFGGRVQLRLPALVGAAKAALRSGAVVLPWINLRAGERFRFVVSEPIGPVPRLGTDIPPDHPELLALCGQLRAQLEAWVEAQPEQWVYWDRVHRLRAENPQRGAE